MSLILDALKRAEQERKLGQPPEAGQVATMSPIATPAHSRDRTLIVVLAILLLAAAIVIGALLLRSRQAAVIDVQPVAAKPAPVAIASVPPPARPVPSAVPGRAPPPAAIAEHGNVSNLDDVVASDDGSAENEQAAQVAEGNLSSESGTATGSHAGSAHTPAQSRPSGPAANPNVTVSSDTPGAVVEQDTPPARPDAMPLRDMPAGYRDSFPQIAIDVHVYNDDPEHRFIIVGGTTYHEGSRLPQGPSIVAITSDGVVLDWQGQRVLYALGAN